MLVTHFFFASGSKEPSGGEGGWWAWFKIGLNCFIICREVKIVRIQRLNKRFIHAGITHGLKMTSIVKMSKYRYLYLQVLEIYAF